MTPRIAWLGAWALAGCATSIAPDVAHVRDLAQVEDLPEIVDDPVDPEPTEELDDLLEAPLDDDTAVRIALLNNREIRATLREMGIARGRITQARALPNPTIEVELLPERNTQFELRVEYDLTHALLAPVRRRSTEPELEAARVRAAALVIEIGYEVRAAFYAAQATSRRLALAQQMLDGLAASMDAAAAMNDAGNLPPIETTRRKATYERARASVAKLELDVALRREALQRLLGLHGSDTGWAIVRPLETVPTAPPGMHDIETRALRASLDLTEMRHRLDTLAKRAGLARAEGRTPEIAIDVHALQGNPETDGTDDDWRFGAGLSVGIPSFDRQHGTARAIDAEFDALMERYHGAAIALRSTARMTRSVVESAHARARHYAEVILPAQREVTDQTLLQYNAMQLGIFEVLAALREQLATETEHIETVQDYWTSVAALDALLAGKAVAVAGSDRVSAMEPTTLREGVH